MSRTAKAANIEAECDLRPPATILNQPLAYWTHSFDKPDSGSVLSISWNNDGTVVAGAGGNGAVIFGYIVDRYMAYANFEAVLDEYNKINVQDCLHELDEDLDFRERVVNMSM